MAGISGSVDQHVCFPGRELEYCVRVGYRLNQTIAQFVLTRGSKVPSKIVIISDTNVWPLYGDSLLESFQEELEIVGKVSDVSLLHRELAPGEQTKCRSMKAELEDWMVKSGCRRDTVVIALGGGVVGDLAGFVASTFMRGVPVVQVPTSLLAMVDSSIGGKTAIDIPAGKNLVGAFHQPAAVFIDLSVLPSLPLRHFCNGMAEVIKTAAIADAELFQLLEGCCHTLLDLASAGPVSSDSGCLEWGSAEQRLLLQQVISRTAGIKVSVVNRDEKEGGLRAILNFGHTVGHGIEALLAPGMLHGEAVAVGLVKEAEAARDLGKLGHDAVARIQALCKAFKLPVRVPSGLAVSDIAAGMAVDKKNTGSDAHPRAVLLSDIGAVHGPPYAQAVHSDVWARLLSHGVDISGPRSGAPLGSAADPITVHVPGSKSLTNRALLLAGLAQGETILTGVLLSDDTLVMIAALGSMGVPCTWISLPNGTRALKVSGGGGSLQLPASGQIFVNNAGTAARFLTSALCFLPSSAQGVVLDGNARMRQRPIGDLVSALQGITEEGCVTYEGQEGFLPLRIRGGGLRCGTVTMRGKVSSQYVSSVLMAGALAAAGGGGGTFTLQLEEEHPTSLPYITMTATCMQAFGVPVTFEADNRYVVGGVTGYIAPPSGRYAVEPDASSATYPAAWAAVTGGAVHIPGLQRASSTQGDVGFLQLLAGMGAQVLDVPPSDDNDGGVTVVGPAGGALGGNLKALPGDTNMENCTDAFLTMAAVAAGAAGTTRIVGVENQRVKECNRITALATEFAKCGVDIKELPDGLVIVGKGGASPQGGGCSSAHPPSVHGYDDHRVAMSLAVLTATGTLPYSRVHLDDAWCVEKTYPTFWSDWTGVLGCGAAAPSTHASGGSEKSQGGGLEAALPTPVHSVAVLIGMRGVGKSHLSAEAAAQLGPKWRVADIDADISTLAGGKTAAEIVQDRGWEAFRALEVQALQAALAQCVPACGGSKPRGPAEGVLIACGGGVVESEAARSLLQSISLDVAGSQAGVPVIWLRRKPEHLAAELGVEFASNDSGASEDRPSYGESFGAVFARRAPWFERCSSHTFDILPTEECSGQYEWHSVQQAFVHMLCRIGVGSSEGGVLSTPAPLHRAPGSKFVCFTAKDLPSWATAAAAAAAAPADACSPETAFIRAVTAGVDAVEVRLDLLKAGQDMATAASLAARRECAQACMQQVQWLRQHLYPQQQIIATVRSTHEGGKYQADPDASSEAIANMAYLLQAAAAAGCEYVDVETWMAPGELAGLLRRITARGARVIASKHITTHTPSAGDIADICSQLCSLGTAVVKLVVMARHPSDVLTLQMGSHASQAALQAEGRGIITLAMGEAGKASRVWNRTLTPVTHPAMPAAAAPGQLTAAQVNELALWQGMTPPESFKLYGSPISASPSPAMHVALFHWCGLPHTYSLGESEQLQLLQDDLHTKRVQGGNVTIPLKQEALVTAGRLSPAAAAIGALNTLYQQHVPGHEQPQVVGENTDWLGMARPVQAAMAVSRRAWEAAANSAEPPSTPLALVLGAGGTARAACFAARSLGLVPVVWNRTASKAKTLADAFGGVAVESLEAQALLSILAERGAGGVFGVVFDTLPPSADVQVPHEVLAGQGPSAVVLVATYSPPTQHALTAAALQLACPVVTGRDMIVHQGVEAFRYWTHGRVAPVAIAAHAVSVALKK